MSNIDKTNIKRSKKKDKKIIAIKEIIQNHHTTSTKKVQIFLVEEYKLAIPLSSLKRYLAKIKKEKNKKIKKPKISKPKKQESNEITYPYFIKDPSGKEHKITGDNMTVSIGWGNSGRLITYDTKDKIWRYDNNGRVFDKNKKPQKFFKIHSNNVFEFDDL